MPLRLEGRSVGDVLIVQCSGRIVTGPELYALHAHIGDAFANYVDVVVQLDEVPFIDSSGLGALVRLM
jgi:anti-anti-sigma factor